MLSIIQKMFKEKGRMIVQEPDFSKMFSELMENLGSIDSDTREGSLDILWDLIDSAELPAEKMLHMGRQLVENLSQGIGEKNSDSVFLRTFSVLLVGALVDLDEAQTVQGKNFITKAVFQNWFAKCKAYVLSEKDFRSFVPEKGWAHSISHGADVLRDFAFHRYTNAKDHSEILEILTNKLLENNEEVYINNDDNRIARVVVTIMLRNELKLADYEKWLDGLLTKFNGQSWVNFADDRLKLIPWFNTITFLRALYFVLIFGMKVIEEGTLYKQVPVLRAEVMTLVENMLRRMDQGLNYRSM